MKHKKARVIAFYLPQFHPIPENDEWWGKGFTEWLNVGKAKPLFKGHYQPHVPADLGYYDLRVPETRKAQADMAREAGVEGFCYWHYWFGNGKMLLERPFQEVLKSGEPDFPFCLGWANHSWEDKSWVVTNSHQKSRMLIEQLYPGEKDYRDHFFYVLDALKDKRYIRVDDKPLFYIYDPLHFKDMSLFISIWQQLARENGLNGIYFIGHLYDPKVSIEQVLATGVDAVNPVRLHQYMIFHRSLGQKIRDKWNKLIGRIPLVFPYRLMSKYFLNAKEDALENVIPTIISGWDHTPRSGKRGLVMTDTTPEQFEKHVAKAIEIVSHKPVEYRIIMLKSWNEWAEGNYVEPDLKFGLGFLDALKNEIFDK